MVKKIFLILKINYNREEIKILNKIIEEFDIKETKKVKKIENITKHDVKAVEYYLDEKFKGKSERKCRSFRAFTYLRAKCYTYYYWKRNSCLRISFK